jgi:putative component of toxin-antitoxin plasmid stabilization module
MKFELKEIPQLTGRRCKIYSVLIDGEDKTLFNQFLEENENDFPEEVINILKRLNRIGNNDGAKEHYFRPKKEGKLGDGVEALFDEPHARLRVYSIKYGNILLVLGGGGYKSKDIRAFQEDPKLTKENYLLRQIAAILYKAIREKDLRWNKQGDNFEGQFYFDSNDY